MAVPSFGYRELCTGVLDLDTGILRRSDGEAVKLTRLELTLLRYLDARAGQIVSAEQLHAEVWGHTSRVVSRAVDNTTSRLRKKIEPEGRDPVHLLRIPGEGFVFSPRIPLAERTPLPEAGPPAGSVPAAVSSFVGRAAELAALAERIDEARLVTVIGAGGVGKTRLVLRLARQQATQQRWPGGVWFCPLAEARSEDDVLGMVVQALGVPLGGGDEAACIGRALAGRGRCLLVLDNFEQIVPHAAATVGRWLALAAEARIVVTSRSRLGLRGERLLELGPLAPAEGLELFAERAREHVPGYAVDAQAASALIGQLDGLPLAIELAAARARTMTPGQMLSRMGERFRLLRQGTPGQSGRQATLRAAIEWSWGLLGAWEQAAFAQLSVFEGGFSLEAAEAVLDLRAFPDAPWPADAVQALVDRSLVQRRSVDPLGAPRFGMLLSVQAFAAEQRGADAGAARRHAEHFAELGQPEALRRWEQMDGPRRRALLLERDNLLAAAGRAQTLGDGLLAARLALAAAHVCQHTGLLRQAAELLVQARAALGADAPPRLRLEVLLLQAALRVSRGDVEAAAADAQEALALAEALGEGVLCARALWMLGRAATRQRALREADTLLERALLALQGQDSLRVRAVVLAEQAILIKDQGDRDRAASVCREALDLSRAAGHRDLEATVLGNLADICGATGRLEEAGALYQQVIQIEQALGSVRRIGRALNSLGLISRTLGRLDEAEAYLERALALAQEIGDRNGEGIALTSLGALADGAGQFDLARARYARAVVIVREAGNPICEGNVLINLAILNFRSGDHARALEQMAAVVDLQEAIGNLYGQTLGLYNLALMAEQSGDLRAAERHLERSAALCREVGDRVGLGMVLGALGEISARLGGEEGRALLAEGEALLREVSAASPLVSLLCRRATMEHRSGQLQAARVALHEARALAGGLSLHARAALSEELGRAEAALAEAGGGQPSMR